MLAQPPALEPQATHRLALDCRSWLDHRQGRGTTSRNLAPDDVIGHALGRCTALSTGRYRCFRASAGSRAPFADSADSSCHAASRVMS
ncbi:protein EFR3 homolog B isoform X1 [Tachysurus ichikawai]